MGLVVRHDGHSIWLALIVIACSSWSLQAEASLLSISLIQEGVQFAAAVVVVVVVVCSFVESFTGFLF